MNVSDVGIRPHQRQRLAAAQRHGCDGGKPSCLHHPHAVQLLDVGSKAGVAYQDGNVVPGPRLSLSQDLNVVLDPTEDGEVVFVEVEDLHSTLLYTSNVFSAV